MKRFLTVTTFAVPRPESSRRIQTSKEKLLRIIWQLTRDYKITLVLSTTDVVIPLPTSDPVNEFFG